MKYKKFGKTNLNVSVVGFGAWGIGGPAMVGSTPIGWGKIDDNTSTRALFRAKELGINFYDTADFYGLGHSEEMIGRAFGNSSDVIIATKVGHRATNEQTIALDYSKKHIFNACEKSLRRLQRDTIDFYQLHSAKITHLEQGECIEAMEQLKEQGKIRYWGLSLNTFHPQIEADYLMDKNISDGFQLVFNIINQRAKNVIVKAEASGYGVIARMPLQFGLLTGAITEDSTFATDDHRHFRLTKEIIRNAIAGLEHIWSTAENNGVAKTSLALSFCAKSKGISTIIPGIKTPEQAELNTEIIELDDSIMKLIEDSFSDRFSDIVSQMEKQG